MAALLGFEKSTTSEAITVSRREIIITEQINKFFDAPNQPAKCEHLHTRPPKTRFAGRIRRCLSRRLIFVSKLFATYDTVVM
jgi:hypothetical protein